MADCAVTSNAATRSEGAVTSNAEPAGAERLASKTQESIAQQSVPQNVSSLYSHGTRSALASNECL